MLLCTSSDKGPYMSGGWWLNVVRFRRFAIPIACPEKKKNNNKDSTEIRKTIKDSNVLESFNNNKDSTEIRKTIKDSNVLESFNKKDSTEIRKTIKDSEEFGIF